MAGKECIKSIYNSSIIDFLLNNIEIIIAVICGSAGLLNIICSIQNIKTINKFLLILLIIVLVIWVVFGIITFFDISDLFLQSSNEISNKDLRALFQYFGSLTIFAFIGKFIREGMLVFLSIWLIYIGILLLIHKIKYVKNKRESL